MSVAAQPELDEIEAGIARWLVARRGVVDLVVTRCERPDDGLSSDTLMVDVRGTRDGVAYSESLVVRRAPTGPGVFPEYDLAAQARVQEVVADQGVPAAVPVELETDSAWLGSSFMVMPAISGYIPNQAPVGDGWIKQASFEEQRKLCVSFFDVLASIHRVDWRQPELAGVVPDRSVDAELATWGRYLDWFGDGEVLVPGLVDALAWCTQHRPDPEPPPTLIWGDVRLGNVIFDDDQQPRAVLDWEMTGIGPPEHDVAWYLSLDAIQHELFGRSVPGFLERDAAIAHYETGLGRPLQDLAWFEILAMVRSTAIMTRLIYLQVQAGQPPMLPLADNPFVGNLARRIEAASG
jgi:aminoglycoside phosphotransferase (APT) family kinase protein